MKTLVCTVGLPQSGKTTWVRAQMRDHGAPVVNPDAIRLAIHGQRFVGSAEPFVWATAKAMVRSLFLAGHDVVIVDATNISKKRRDEWQSPDWRTVFYVLETTAQECLRRADEKGDAEIKPVIERMSAEAQPLDPSCEARVQVLGATGNFPDGALDPNDDQGELKMAISADKRAGIVRLEFGKPVAWLGLPKKEAAELAEQLRRHASKL